MKKLLAVDAGGTWTRLAIAEVDGDLVRVLRQQRCDNAGFTGFDALLDAFLAAAPDSGAIGVMVCAVAGPVDADGRAARLTNRGWTFDAGRITHRLDGATVRIINDFSAVGIGIDALADDDLVTLQAGQPRARAPRCVLGAGTGLGAGWLVHDGTHYRPQASEGGHVDFAPNGALQRDLLAWLARRHRGHVSVERIVSGPGLVDLFRFLCEQDPDGADPLAQALAAPDPAAHVSALAAEVPDGLAAAALDLFVSIYGATAGNLALTLLPAGGLWLAGGIAPRMIDRLRDGRFLAAFNDKGRMSALTAQIPVTVIMNPDVGLLGAIAEAQRAVED